MAEMRRSCNFCRQRRMRCNGELPWCGACHERNTPCVYESVGARGRPRRKESEEKLMVSPAPLTTVSSRSGASWEETTLSQIMVDAQGKMVDVNPDMIAYHTVGDRLGSIDGHIWSLLKGSEEAKHCLKLALSDPDKGLIPLLEQLVHLAIGKSTGELQSASIQDISSLGDMGSIRKVVEKEENTEELALTPSQVMQLIDLAFILHPFLSLVVSKTSLLYEHRDGIAFSPLLLTIAAEGVELGLPRTEPLFKEAALLTTEELTARAESELLRSGDASTIACHSLPLCQTLLLLIYRMLIDAQVRSAAVYLTLCCQLLDRIWEKRCNETIAEVKMNGVQLANVEEELLCNITWLASSFSMWISLQLPTLGTSVQMRYRLDFSQLPILDINRSALYQLDFMSGNLAVLKSQEHNGRILSSLASVHCYVEQYLCDTASPSSLSLDTSFTHSNKEAEALVSTVSRLLGLKSCLLFNPAPSSKMLLRTTHIHVILTIAGRTVEGAAAAGNTASTSPLQTTTVGLQVETISNLAVAFELLLAFAMPSLRTLEGAGSSHYFERFDVDAAGLEMVENNKWQMMMTLQSLAIILTQESMSCAERFNVKSQVDQLTSNVQNILLSNEADFTTTAATAAAHANSTMTGNVSTPSLSLGASQASVNNSANLFGSGNAALSSHAHHHSLATATYPTHHPRRHSQHYTYDFAQQQPLMSPRYFSVPFSDIDSLSSHPIFNPFQPQQQQQQSTPTSKTFANASMMFYHDDGMLPLLSPTEHQNYLDDGFQAPSSAPMSHSLSLHAPPQGRSQAFNIKSEAHLMQHYGSDAVIFSNSPYPQSDYLNTDYRTA